METKAIILGAGMGTRMNSSLPKVLHEICGIPMIQILLKTVEKAGIQDITVVVGPHMDNLKQAVAPYRTVEQTERLGTGHAVLMAQDYLKPFDGCVLILFGDSPLLKPETLTKMVQKYQEGFDVVVLGFIPQDARRYGRLVMSEAGLEEIVEYKDATDEQRAIKLCNSGVMCLNGQHALALLKEIKNNNAAQEYYLTDVVKLAKEQGLKRDIVICDVDEAHGINTPEELEAAEMIYRERCAKDA